MNAKGKLRIIFSEDEADDGFCSENRAVLADAVMHVIKHSNFSMLEVHIIMPSENLEQMLDGIQQAGVDLSFEAVAPLHKLN